jgi:hypothetical protein
VGSIAAGEAQEAQSQGGGGYIEKIELNFCWEAGGFFGHE